MKSLFLLFVSCVVLKGQAQYTCKQAGRFAEPSDTKCQHYFLCIFDTSTSSYQSFKYVCPVNSVFNANTSKCTASSNYACTISTTSTTTTTTTIAPSSDYQCSITGRYPDSSDTTCQNYFFCIYDSKTSSFYASKHSCPTLAIFNPNTQKCTASSNYKCAVSPTTTTEVPTTTEPTTTEVPTTTEPTTTEVPTTTEPTTTEPTTTEVPTTTDSTTTEVPTTSEPTTTEVPTTSEPTTTEVPTTTEPTTTEAPTTSEPTTTEVPTTTEPTTTEVPTTSEPTTTEAPTTSEPTTTEV